jgi:hypothetical protein
MNVSFKPRSQWFELRQETWAQVQCMQLEIMLKKILFKQVATLCSLEKASCFGGT